VRWQQGRWRIWTFARRRKFPWRCCRRQAPPWTDCSRRSSCRSPPQGVTRSLLRRSPSEVEAVMTGAGAGAPPRRLPRVAHPSIRRPAEAPEERGASARSALRFPRPPQLAQPPPLPPPPPDFQAAPSHRAHRRCWQREMWQRLREPSHSPSRDTLSPLCVRGCRRYLLIRRPHPRLCISETPRLFLETPGLRLGPLRVLLEALEVLMHHSPRGTSTRWWRRSSSCPPAPS